MLRVVGGMMIISGCLGMGLWYRSRLTEQINVVRTLVEVLELFAGEIRYDKATLPECCGILGTRIKEPFGSCLLEVKKELEENRGFNFEAVYKRRMNECLKELPIRMRDREIILTAFDGKEYGDIDMRLRALDRRRELLEESTEQLAGELVNKCRMAVCLGAMSGLLLVIVLV